MAGISKKPRVLVFASGEKEPVRGGSGFQELVEFTRTDPSVLDAEIVGVVSNHPSGGVYTKANALNIQFEYWPTHWGPYTADDYRGCVDLFRADFVMLSGWLYKVKGLDIRKTINIHPGPLPRFGGPGMFGHHVHEAVMAAYRRGEVSQSAVTMHFVDEQYDHGPIFFEFPVLIRPDDDADTLARRVNEKERAWQAVVLNHIVQGHIWLQKTDKGLFRVMHSHTGLNSFCPDRLYEIPQLAEKNEY